ncbi:hypothetical protein ACWC9Q_16010 [Streptomyces sp. NPDC001142]
MRGTSLDRRYAPVAAGRLTEEQSSGPDPAPRLLDRGFVHRREAEE